MSNWPTPSLWYRIKYWPHNKLRHRELTWWRRWWIQACDWLHSKMWVNGWRHGLRPHLTPRAYAVERMRHYRTVPSNMVGYVWQDELDERFWIGEIRDPDGPWDVCCAQGSTREEARKDLCELARWFADQAGHNTMSIQIRYERPGPHTWTG